MKATSGILGYSVRELLQKALKRIIAESTTGPKFDKHWEMEIDLELYDPKLGRMHPVVARIKIKGRSRILESPQALAIADNSQSAVHDPSKQ